MRYRVQESGRTHEARNGAARQETATGRGREGLPGTLFLSKEETVALLDLCLPGLHQADAQQERALQKLMTLARHYHDAEQREEEIEIENAREGEAGEIAPAASPSSTGFSPRSAPGGGHDFGDAVIERILASISA
jgi:hypothetical protein